MRISSAFRIDSIHRAVNVAGADSKEHVLVKGVLMLSQNEPAAPYIDPGAEIHMVLPRDTVRVGQTLKVTIEDEV